MAGSRSCFQIIPSPDWWSHMVCVLAYCKWNRYDLRRRLWRDNIPNMYIRFRDDEPLWIRLLLKYCTFHVRIIKFSNQCFNMVIHKAASHLHHSIHRFIPIRRTTTIHSYDDALRINRHHLWRNCFWLLQVKDQLQFRGQILQRSRIFQSATLVQLLHFWHPESVTNILMAPRTDSMATYSCSSENRQPVHLPLLLNMHQIHFPASDARLLRSIGINL